MRPILHADILRVARLLLAFPPAARPGLVARLLVRADAADRYRKRFRRAHPMWGNGSLGGAAALSCTARQRLAPERQAGDPDFAACMATVFSAVVEWRAAQAGRAGDGRDEAPGD
ncbi:hypothetical protein BV394_00425 [Brevirhabdus pacifica]|uniref:DUF7742 domain-containing protein n=1 Tax=Brevirhabdus pacifica TaxID=1267768 RepID=A0A1U7DEK8_9RHOB|nr:hypothetical protein [Brevirhabdus pacifica]APX88385.1 hypothetical protein BV394_00425 [Brevirhabdus pacifica]PJJ87160.1 hypothetical protein CLV77_1726 [Brevirhabdus pacifica]